MGKKQMNKDWTCDIPGCGRLAPQNDIFCSEHRNLNHKAMSETTKLIKVKVPDNFDKITKVEYTVCEGVRRNYKTFSIGFTFDTEELHLPSDEWINEMITSLNHNKRLHQNLVFCDRDFDNLLQILNQLNR